MKKVYITLVSLLVSITIFAQDYEDLLRFSESFQKGNARFSAMSGAFGSLGANISAMSINPAGSALYRGNIYEFSPAFTLTKTENYFLDSYDRAFTSTIKIPNMGIMFAKNVKENDLFVSGIAFGFSINKQNQFNETSVYNSVNNSNSITDEFVRLANQDLWFEDFTTLANDAYLIGFDETNGEYFSDYRWYNNDNELVTDYGQDQSIGLRKEGTKREYLFNFGVDFSQKVFIGADFGVESIFYTENFDLTETDNAMTKPYLSSFTYKTETDVSGAGVNGKVGVIIKPIEYLRLGIAAHSPSVYSLHDETKSSIQANFDQSIDDYGNTQKSASNVNEFDYQIVTPSKLIASLGFVYKNIAVIGIDYESVDYSYGYLNSKTSNLSEQNTGVSQNLGHVDNLKIGAELRYGPFSFRGGTATYGNPYTQYVSQDPNYRTDVSGGVGLSNEKFYFDIAWVRSNKKEYNTLYSDINNNPVVAESNVKTDNMIMTIGFKF